MRKIKSMMMGGVILLGLAMCLTSCEGTLDDVFGEWSRPTPGGGGSSAINATAIKLSQTMKVIKLGGDALTITATATPTDATLIWESSDPTIATVENGVVTPKALGIATITAKSGDVKATCEVFVGTEVDLGASAYEAKNYDIVKGDMGANQLTIPAGYHVALDGLTINNNNITCSGDATIYLTDGSTNTVTASGIKAGIQIGGTGTTLTINGETAGTGTLTAKGGSEAAGIGTSMNGTGGNIVINGGTVTAKGGSEAAGIGTGTNGTGGNIVINDGTVTATGGDFAAGIGTGYAYGGGETNECDAITINGGTVIATGGKYGAGIGMGYANYSTSKNTCGAITIGTGVTSVTATKGTDSPNSIGTGKNNGTLTCGKIKFGTAEVFDGTAATGTWTPNPMVADTYGGLKLAISGGTWTLTPAP